MTNEPTSLPGSGQSDSDTQPFTPTSFSDENVSAFPATADINANGNLVEQPASLKKPQSGAKAVREIIETLLLALLIFVAVRAVVLNFRVDGNSMFPNLQNGEMLLVNRNVYARLDVNKWMNYIPFVDKDGERVVYLFHPPQRGDIIVFNPPVESDKPYIKRVIALEGDTVEIKSDGYVYVNGAKLEEEYIQGGITDCLKLCKPYTIPEDSVFVLGDNRRNSSDSRSFRDVPIDNIIGKAWLTYWPWDDFGLVPHENYPEIPDAAAN